jgi:branched-chain amino acid transport system substrate-binding protein
LGTKIQFTNRDDKFKVDIGLSMAKELVMMEKVDLLVGTINSAVSLAVSDYVKGEKVPFIVWISKTEKLTGEKGHRYVFCTAENTYMAGKAGGDAPHGLCRQVRFRGRRTMAPCPRCSASATACK